MIKIALPITGAFLLRSEPFSDARGSFARTFCVRAMADLGLPMDRVQTNISRNLRAGTLRGFHYQLPPFSETKLMRCFSGAIFDVFIDLRPGSPTYLKWHGVMLRAEDHDAVYIPSGCAHGYLSLEDDTVTEYDVDQYYTPGAERGIRHDDPVFGIQWPADVLLLSDKDRSWPDFLKRKHEAEVRR